MAGRISEWQRRLEQHGEVRFRQSPWLALLGLALSAFLVFGGLDGIAGEGVAVWSVVLLVLGAVGAVVAVRNLVTGSPGLVVTRDGVRSGRAPVVPLDHIAAAVARGRTLTVDHRPVPGQRLTGRQQRIGLRQLTVTLSPVGGAPAGDLALWLFQLQGGPDARVDVTRRHGRLGELYRPAEQPWWER